MDAALNPVEIRIIGSLIEKQVTTPEHSPLTLNALVNACNQTTNRDPVSTYDEGTIEHAIETLREKSLVWVVRGGRALKYEHRFAEKFELAARELAAMCVLMLRGPQTAGEIRGRTGRLYAFAGLEDVDAALEALMKSEPPLATKLPRVPGTKEPRFAHLLGGEAASKEGEFDSESPATRAAIPADSERTARLESEIAAVREELQELRRQFLELKSQLE